MKTSILIVNVIFALSLLSVSYAADQIDSVKQPQRTAKMLLITPVQHQKNAKHHKNFAHSWRHALQQMKQLSPDQAKIVAMAAVILYGDSDMRVGQITAVAADHGLQNYQVQILNKEGKIIESILMNGRSGRIIFKP